MRGLTLLDFKAYYKGVLIMWGAHCRRLLRHWFKLVLACWQLHLYTGYFGISV